VPNLTVETETFDWPMSKAVTAWTEPAQSFTVSTVRFAHTPMCQIMSRALSSLCRQITIKHLIHHTAALPDYIDLHVAARRSAEGWYDGVMRRRDDWYPQMSRRKKAREVTNSEVLRLVACKDYYLEILM